MARQIEGDSTTIGGGAGRAALARKRVRGKPVVDASPLTLDCDATGEVDQRQVAFLLDWQGKPGWCWAIGLSHFVRKWVQGLYWQAETVELAGRNPLIAGLVDLDLTPGRRHRVQA